MTFCIQDYNVDRINAVLYYVANMIKFIIICMFIAV